jgi:hypothetical protein
LRKRVLRDGSMDAIDPLVDLYNAISLRYAVPVGGENFAAYVGAPRLILADGSEAFDTMKQGVAVNEPPETGEVVWCDDIGVTCRRWNWRQGAYPAGCQRQPHVVHSGELAGHAAVSTAGSRSGHARWFAADDAGCTGGLRLLECPVPGEAA